MVKQRHFAAAQYQGKAAILQLGTDAQIARGLGSVIDPDEGQHFTSLEREA